MKRLIMLLVALVPILVHAQTRTVITVNDLSWQGLYAVPPSGDATPGGPGTPSYSSGALAVRYVNGERRFLMPTFTQTAPTTGQQWGDLVEYRAPTTAPYMGATPASAPALVETRRWANWTAMFAGTASWWSGASGVRIGGLYWDEPNGVLWYQLYGYYDGKNHPFLAAVKLLDTPAGTGNYVVAGPSYGPWWYRDANPSDTNNLYWKQAVNWFVPIPASAQADLKGRTFLVGAGVGAVGGSGHIGPGFHSITAPALTDPPNTVIALGQRLADYSPESTQARREARRNGSYTFDANPNNQSGLQPPVNGVGRWQMSLDQVNSFIWVETATKEGILLFGRQAQGLTWYGYNPRSTDPGFIAGGVDARDPTRPVPAGNGYGATAWGSALYVFDPAQVREVGRGARSPFSDGMNPVSYDWHAQWPNLPLSTYEQVGEGTPQSRPISSVISNTGYWDARAQQVIWVQPMVIGGTRPALSLFTVSGSTTPPPPTTNVDCVVSAFNCTPWLSNAVDQTRTCTRTIVTPPSGTGAACPALSVIEHQPLSSAPPPIVATAGLTIKCSLAASLVVPPDTTGGWSAQYQASATSSTGAYVVTIIWSKAGQASVTQALGTVTCGP